ncbi:MAG: hypothetical protein ABJD07_00100 [Gemmatimonadaceae bacterium]
MSDTQNDDKFDDFLRIAARDYNAPPATPRAEMWARIDAARGAQRGATVVPIASARRPHLLRWTAIAAGMAAMLAIGVALGRRSTGGAIATPSVATGAGTTRGTRTATSSAPHAPNVPNDYSTGTRSPRTDRAGEQRVVSSVDQRTPVEIDAAAALPYRLATLQHLGQTEALLTTVRSNARAGQIDAHVAKWARDLLGNTQLLLDSPAGDDPQLKRLLGDLELVLAQIARLPGPGGIRDTTDFDLIEQAISRHDVLTRIRTTIPAGRVPVGS